MYHLGRSIPAFLILCSDQLWMLITIWCKKKLRRRRLGRCINPATLMIKNPTFSCSHTCEPWIYFLVNLNGANPKLVPFRPAGRLISPPLLLSVILNILLSLAMHIVGFILVQKQPWYSMDYHRYQCGLKSGFLKSDLCQTSSGPYEGRQMRLHLPRVLVPFTPLGEITNNHLSFYYTLLPALLHNEGG